MSPAPGTTNTTDGNGNTFINSLNANRVAGDYQIKIQAKGATGGSVNATYPINFTNIPDYPHNIFVASGNNQTPDVGQLFDQDLVVTVTDQYNNLVGGTNPVGGPNQIIFNSPSNYQTAPSAIITDSSGVTGTTYTATVVSGVALLPHGNIRANNVLNSYTITPTIQGIDYNTLGTKQTFTVTNVASLSLVTTTTEIKQAGGEAFSPLRVRVGGANGTGVAGITVSFSITDTTYGVFSSSACQELVSGTENGTATTVTATTGSDGIATVNNFCAGTLIGSYGVSVTTTIGSSQSSVVIPLANKAYLVKDATNDNQIALANGGSYNPLGVYVIGYQGANIPNASVSFSVPSVTNASISPAGPVLTNNGGLAQANLTAGSSIGSFTTTATLLTPAGVLTQTFTLTNTVKVVFTSSAPALLAGSTATNGATQDIVAQVRDFTNAPVDNVNVQFSIDQTSRANFTGQNAAFSGTSGSGNATVNIRGQTQVGGYTITATPFLVAKQIGTASTQVGSTYATISSTLQYNPMAGQQGLPISVTVKGASGVNLTGVQVKFTVQAGSESMATVVTSPVASVSGVATTTLNIANTAGPFNVIATLDPTPFSPGAVPSTNTSVTIPILNMVQLAVNGNPNTTLYAGGFSSDGTPVLGESVPISFTAKGTGAATVGGVQVRLTSSDSTRGAFSGAASGVVTLTTDVASGTATGNLVAGNSVGSYSVDVAGFIGANRVTASQPITISALTTGRFDATTFTNLIQAGGATQPISVTLKGNTDSVSGKTALVSGATIQFSTDLTGTTLSTLNTTQTATTGSDGAASLNVTTTNKIGYFDVTANIKFTPDVSPLQLPSPQTVSVVNTATITVGAGITTLAGTGSVPITATVKGFNNTAINGAAVIFSTTDSTYAGFGNSPQVSASTDTTGVASSNFSSKLMAGSYNMKAFLDPTPFNNKWDPGTGAIIPVTNTVTFAFLTPAKTSLAAATTSSTNDGESTPLTVTVKGASNQAVAGVTVNYSITDNTKGHLDTLQSVSSGLVTYTNVLTASNGLGSYVVQAQAVATNNPTIDIGGSPVTYTVATTAQFAAFDGTLVSTPYAGSVPVTITYRVQGYSGPVEGVRVGFTTDNTNRATVSATPVTSASGTGNVQFAFTTGNQAGVYTVTATLLDNPTPQTKSKTFTNMVRLISDYGAQPLAGGDTDSMVVTAQGGSTGSPVNISGVSLTFTTPTSGPGGSVATGTYVTDSNGRVTVPVTSSATGYGAWNLGVSAIVSTTNVGNMPSYSFPVTNTLLITSTAATNSNPPRPVANGGSDTATVQVSGANNYHPLNVPVTFSTSAVSGCGTNACGLVNSTFNTDASGIATATITAITGTVVTASQAQAYSIQANLANQVSKNGVGASLVTPIQAINTVKVSINGGPVTFNSTQPVGVTVTDNQNTKLSGFNVQFRILKTNGAVGDTTNDGYLCLNTCDTSTSPPKYLGALITTNISGTAGINQVNQVQAVSLTGSTNPSDYAAVLTANGANGISLIQTGSNTLAHFFNIEAVVIMPGLPTGEIGPSKTINIVTLIVVPPTP